MAAIESQKYIFGRGITQVELMRTDHVALRAEAEELALDGVEIMLVVDFHSQYLIQRLFQQVARGSPVNGSILEPIRDPDVRYAGRAKLPTEVRADMAAGDA